MVMICGHVFHSRCLERACEAERCGMASLKCFVCKKAADDVPHLARLNNHAHQAACMCLWCSVVAFHLLDVLVESFNCLYCL